MAWFSSKTDSSIAVKKITPFFSAKGIKFKRDVLVRELLMLGNTRITPNIAKLVGDEVEKEIYDRRLAVLDAETLNNIVTEKLLELGLVENSTDQKLSQELEGTQREILSQDLLKLLLPQDDKNEKNDSLLVLKQIPSKIELSYGVVAQEKIVAVCAKRDFSGKLQEFCEDIFVRVAKSLTQADIKFEHSLNTEKCEVEWYNFLASGVFLPQLSLLSSFTSFSSTTGSSFVVDDAAESVAKGLQNLIAHQMGGNSTFIVLKPRAAGDIIGGKTLTALNPKDLLKFYRHGLALYKTEGGVRHEVSFDLNHPQVEDFLEALLDKEENIFRGIFAVDKAFIEALGENGFISLLNPRTHSLVRKIPVQYFLEKFIEIIKREGELNFYAPHLLEQCELMRPDGGHFFKEGERTLQGDLNIACFVEAGQIQWGALKAAVHRALHFLDNSFVLMHENTFGIWKMALGFCGWAECLVKMDIPYLSREALILAQQLMSFIRDEMELESAHLALTRGVSPHIKRTDGPLVRHAGFVGLGNSDELATIFGTSPGIEPLDDAKQVFYQNGEIMTVEAWESFFEKQNNKKSDTREVFKKSHEIPAVQHLYMQQVCERHADGLVHKKIPFHDLTPEGLKSMLLAANRLGLKSLNLVHSFQEQVPPTILKSSAPSQKGDYFSPR